MMFDRPMRTPRGDATRRLRRLPIWLRVSGAIALVLAGVLLTTMVLAAEGAGDRGGHGTNHGSGGQIQMETNGGSTRGDRGSGGDHSSRGDHTSGGGHGSDHDTE